MENYIQFKNLPTIIVYKKCFFQSFLFWLREDGMLCYFLKEYLGLVSGWEKAVQLVIGV